MHAYIGSKLILVEGLTGSGKSIMAHFIARQLQYHGFLASWVHEAEVPHPILLDDQPASLDTYMLKMRQRWADFVDQVGLSAEVRVVEACFFNNLIETLLAHNVERSKIIEYFDELQALIEPLDPTLVYLVQQDLDKALERNFANRGKGFENFVIRLVADMPVAIQRGWQGYAGMRTFWGEFVALTDELFHRFHYHKLKIDNSAGDWQAYRRQVMQVLGLPLIPEQGLSPAEAQALVGLYRANNSGKEFTVHYEDGELTINIFLNVRTRLVRQAQGVLLAEGWHFELSFEYDDLKGVYVLRFGGRDVDYLALVGTLAEKIPA